jgi:hypothetical protein
MCLTISPAMLSKTYIANFSLNNSKDRVLYYQNSITNKSDSEYNVMLLVIDGSVNKIIDTTDTPNVITDIAKRISFINQDEFVKTKGFGSRSVKLNVEKVGIYTIYSSTDIQTLSTSILYYNLEIPKMYIDFYRKHYKAGNYTFLAFVWEGNKPIEAQPICIRYNSNSGLPYFPMVDGHDGGEIALNQYTDYDHTLLFNITEGQARGLTSLQKINSLILGQNVSNIIKYSVHESNGTSVKII